MTSYAIFYLRSAAYGSLPGERVVIQGNKKYISMEITERDSDPLQTPGTIWFTIEQFARVYTGAEIHEQPLEVKPTSYLDVLTALSDQIYHAFMLWLGKHEPLWLRVYCSTCLSEEERPVFIKCFLGVEMAIVKSCDDIDAKEIFDFWVCAIHRAVGSKRITMYQARELIGKLNVTLSDGE